MKTSKSNPLEQRFLHPGEAAALLGVGSGTLKRWALAGKIPAIRLPTGVMRYDGVAIIAALAVATIKPAPAPKPVKKIEQAKTVSVSAPVPPQVEAQPVDVASLVASLETAPVRERVAGASLGGRR